MHNIENLLQRARRRVIGNEALGQLAFAAAVGSGGLALLLIFGTRYLEWWTVSLFAAFGFAIGLFRVVRRTPGLYALALRLDGAAGLHDLLSTAIYFDRHPRGSAEFRNGQRLQAEEAARSVDLEAALPFTLPHSLYAMAALTLLASGLVALRYGIRQSLDLRAPITEVLFQDLAARPQARQQSARQGTRSLKALKAAESLMAKLNAPANADEHRDPDALDNAIDQALAPPSEKSGKNDKTGQNGKAEQGKNGNAAEQTPNGDPLDDGQSASAASNQEQKSPASQEGASGDKATSRNGDGNSNLLSKLKDAVSNMFSRSSQDGTQQDRKNGSQPSGQPAKSDRQSGEKSSGGKGQQHGEAQTDAQEGDPNGDPQQGQQAQGKAGAKSSAQNSAQAGSGIGSQDGAKDLRAAEQLKAMGKISEILGKRAATITGETMVEVQSGNQQLKTAYSSQSANHGESDSDLNRDEIPVALQSYVEQYFEQVRKAAPPVQRKTGHAAANPN